MIGEGKVTVALVDGYRAELEPEETCGFTSPCSPEPERPCELQPGHAGPHGYRVEPYHGESVTATPEELDSQYDAIYALAHDVAEAHGVPWGNMRALLGRCERVSYWRGWRDGYRAGGAWAEG